LLILAVLLLGVFAVQARDSPTAHRIPTKDWKDPTAFKVLRIIDGDTVVIEQNGAPVKVRLIGVDTPETVHPNRPVEAYGREASRFTTNLLKGEAVYLEHDHQKTDRYGRTLAYL
jgi:micrococcal nuclease